MKFIGYFFAIASVFGFIGGKWNSNLKNCEDCNDGSGAGFMLATGVLLVIIEEFRNKKA